MQVKGQIMLYEKVEVQGSMYISKAKTISVNVSNLSFLFILEVCI